MKSWIDVYATEHAIGILDHHQLPVQTANWSNGLIVTMASGALIYTGINRGPVRVAVKTRRAAPGRIDPGPWDDIIEASVHAPIGDLHVDQLEYLDGHTPPAFPRISSAGVGHYRIRVHVRGRDLHYDDTVDEPCEDYLIVAWPSSPQPDLIVRATDECGYDLRANSLNAAESPGEPARPATPTGPSRQDLLDDNLRRATPDPSALP